MAHAEDSVPCRLKPQAASTGISIAYTLPAQTPERAPISSPHDTPCH
jgi:hypothetical protein